jgi:hypothetical protein
LQHRSYTYFFSRLVKYWLVGLGILLSGFAEAQEVIKGIVVDSATFAPLPYVSVQIKNKSRGVNTDHQGNFSILALPQDTLLLSLLGYERLELPLLDYEASVIRLSERATILKTITINETRSDNPYEGLFDDQNAALLKRRIPFYFSKARKEKIRVGRWRDENIRVQTYVDVVINNPETKANLIKKFSLTDEEYYTILTQFNEKHYNVMYYLTAAELISFLNQFFEKTTAK